LPLYFNIAALQQRPGKTFWGSWEVLEKSWNFLELKNWEPWVCISFCFLYISVCVC